MRTPLGQRRSCFGVVQSKHRPRLRGASTKLRVRVAGSKATLERARRLQRRQARVRRIRYENRALREEGSKRNRRVWTGLDKKTGLERRTRPTAIRRGRQTVEVIDRKRVSFGFQLRLQWMFSRLLGFRPLIITGRYTRVSETVKRLFDIKRKPYLGPQQPPRRRA